MAKKDLTTNHDDYVQLGGSERHPSSNARLLEPADPQERLSVTIVLRRRPDGQPIPDFDHFKKVAPRDRPRLSEKEFVRRHGASDDDLKQVSDFARARGLTVKETHPARRHV